MSLFKSLIGAWKLKSYQSRPVDSTSSGAVIEPLGSKPTGMILYTPDGYVSAQLYRGDAALSTSSSLLAASDEELVHWSRGAVSCAGALDLEDAELNNEANNNVLVSLFPNWIGGKQVRSAKVEGNQLTLSTPPYEHKVRLILYLS